VAQKNQALGCLSSEGKERLLVHIYPDPEGACPPLRRTRTYAAESGLG